MAGDNTLGAPTEGLGQTVTFGFKNTAREGSEPVRRGRINSGIRGQAGANVPMARGSEIKNDGTVDMLMKVGQGIIDKEIKEARTSAFVTGMQRAMTGEAVEDIAAGQPAWSRVFGDSDAVEGARAYSSETKVQEVLLSIENDMPNLRRMGPKEANQFFVKSVNAALTGDAATDHAIMSSVQRNLPGVMKRHAGQHYAYMQEEAATQESTALSAAAARLQNAGIGLSKGEFTAEDFAEQQASVSMLSVPAIGRDPEWVRKQRTQSALLMTEQGQFHALNAMQKIGMFDLLHPDQKAQIIRSRQANETKWKAQYGQEFSNDLTELRMIDESIKLGQLPKWTPRDTLAKVQDINRRYKERTGSESDYFNADLMAAYGERTAQGIAAVKQKQISDAAAEAKAHAAAGQKALAEQANQSAISIAMGHGDLAASISMGLIKDNDVDKTFVPRATAAFSNILSGKPADLGFLIDNGIKGYYNVAVQKSLMGVVHGAVAGGVMSPTFVAAYEGWRQINEKSPGTAAGYYGDAHAKFQRFALVNPGPVDLKSPFLSAAFEGSFGPNAKRFGASIDKKGFADLVKKSTEVGNSGKLRPEMLGGDNKLRPGQAEFLANAVRHRAEVLADSTTLDQAMEGAITIGANTDLHILGGYVWEDRKNRDFIGEIRTRLKGKFGLGSTLEASQDFGEVVDEEIKRVGGMPNPRIYRDKDMLVGFDTVGGEARTFTITLDKIAEELMKRGTARRGPPPTTYSDGKKSAWYRFGSEITYQEDRAGGNTQSVPGPYTSDEDRAYFRKNGKMPVPLKKQLPTVKPQEGRDPPTLGNN